MPSRPPRHCTTPGCAGEVLLGRRTGKCPSCQQRSTSTRPSSTVQGYGAEHRDRFRKGVLQRHPVCVLCQQRPATEADHYPLSRRELVAKGFDPDDPARGRGLCKPCHSSETARHQPGGWAAEPGPQF